MNTKPYFLAAATVFAAISTFGASVAFAGEATYDYPSASASNLSRSEVRAETLKASAAGLIERGERSVVIASTGPGLTRAQVKAETLEAVRLGVISRHEKDVIPSAEQLERIRLAGQKAAAMTMASL